ncbi:amino acid adenylation domain-containing protein [Alcanivorax sp. S71-1-4]|uniref:non-ribosomal peptide synthetase n=1 Tax=Alcanivorax sp. S71-1-4 TaxID=1177159 RepID=UPI0013593D24|nr:non-ribosomal peptide synthetase [Alcanivorax sp. S71-1-4]KAF0809376.1 amino acid adenylation domain-containing protein [Alcanivorax sp. S71-1-4]
MDGMTLDAPAFSAGEPLSPEQRAAGAGVLCLSAHLPQPDGAALRAALAAAVARHDSFRQALRDVPGYRGLRRVSLPTPARVSLVELSGASLAAASAALTATPFALGEGDVLRAGLWRAADNTAHLLLAGARQALDAGSLCRLLHEITGAPATDEAFAYQQFCAWRAALEQDEEAAAGRAYWQAQPEANALRLPVRRMLAASAQRHQATQYIDLDSAARLDTLAARCRVEERAVWHSVWCLLLARLSGESHFLSGWQHDCRQDYEVMASGAGVFEKILPVLTQVSDGLSFSDAIARHAHQCAAHSQAQEYYALDTVDERTRAVGFHWLPLPGGPLVQAPAPHPDFELVLQVQRHETGATLLLQADSHRYSPAALQTLLSQYQWLLAAAADAPAADYCAPPLVSAAQQQALLDINNDSRVFEPVSLPAQIARHAAQQGDAVALVQGEQTLTYHALQQRAGQLAQWLREQGAAPGERVALQLGRSLDAVVAILAIWHTGAAYLPLDERWPAARRRAVLDDAKPVLVLHAAANENARPPEKTLPAWDSLPPAQAAASGALAYVLYTSGSTGTPKGVLIEHSQLLNYVAAASAVMDLPRARRWALTGALATDLGNTALFGALFNGATLVIASDDDMADGAHFAGFLRREHIDALKMVPSHLEALLESAQPVVPSLLVLGGEAASPALLSRLATLAPHSRVFNHYGPTETTVGVMVHAVDLDNLNGEPLPLTRVLPNNRCYVLDARQRLTPVGAVGELYIGGAQVCAGYLGGYGEDVFGHDPFLNHYPGHPGGRLYRTGDLACVSPGGGFRLIGRADDQIALRGFRIEPAEVEQALRTLPGVRNAIVRAQSVRQGDAELVAFLEGDAALAQASAAQFSEQLAALLPAPMHPSRYLCLAAFPRLPNGKTDLAALALLASSTREQAAQDSSPPRDALESLICVAMGELLNSPPPGRDADFFALGGHSLLVIKLVARCRKTLGVEVAPGVVFDFPTPARLADWLRAHHGGDALTDLADAWLRSGARRGGDSLSTGTAH